MLKTIRSITKLVALNLNRQSCRVSMRTFLSQSYYCNEVWEHRLRNPILVKVKLEELYQDLEQRYNKTKTISAVDVDIFANAVTDGTYVDELLDLVHKLRLSADTGNTLNSTSHAVIRYLITHERNEDLLNVLDDRLNYGLFLDDFTANILMNAYYKNKDFLSGARVASQLMYQEDFNHPLSRSLALLHCYNYLLKPTQWPQLTPPAEPEDEVKIRVKYLRNPYYDDHFDIRDPLKIVGKTLWMATKDLEDPLDKSLHLLGLGLHDKLEKATKLIESLRDKNEKIYVDAINLLPEENETRKQAIALDRESENIQSLLESRAKQAERSVAEEDVANQCELYTAWENERLQALNKQIERLTIENRLANVEVIQKELKEREVKLWFFENEEQIELAIQEKQELIKSYEKPFGKKKTQKEDDANYIPPEV